MHSLVARVPRLQMLAVFEAAARLGSLTEAAVELGMTQSGVSRQISNLERALGSKLFDRQPNRVVLNQAGTTFLVAVQSAFDTIDAGIRAVPDPVATLVLAANPGFAQRWLVPYLDSLQSALGSVDVRLRLFDRDADLIGTDFDAAIHLTRTAGLPFESQWLFDEQTIPVASPGYAQSHGLGPTTAPAALLGLDLLALDGRDRQWMNWADWFHIAGESWSQEKAKVWYNNYTLTIDDAIAGRGIALGWSGLIDADIDRGLLVQVGPRRLRHDFAYHLIPGRNIDGESLVKLARWWHDISDQSVTSG